MNASKFVATAVSPVRRNSLAPNLQSMEEIGTTGVDIELWNAFVAPASIPAAQQVR